MTKRHDLVRELEHAGFVSKNGARHEKFSHPDGRTTFVPRHREISEAMSRIIRKQAGLDGGDKR